MFHKAIIESGSGRDDVLTGTNAVAIAQLRVLNVSEIIDCGQETDGQGGALIYSGLILDSKLVAKTAQSAYENNRVPKIPITIGSNSAEVPGGFIKANTREALLDLFGNLKEDALKYYETQDTSSFTKLMTLVTTDMVWAEPARFTARAFSKKDVAAYVYLFYYVPASMQQRWAIGAPHSSEIAYVFNNLNDRWGCKFSY